VRASARRLLTVAIACLLAATAMATIAGSAKADGSVPLRWTDYGGGTSTGQVETDRDRQQIIASLMADAPAAGPSRTGSSGPAPRCVWSPWAQVAASMNVRQGGGMNGGLDRTLADGTPAVLYARVCEDGTVTDWRWFAVPNQAALLATAREDVRRRLPLPMPVLSPDPTVGLVVKVATWFAVPAAQWTPIQATATALGTSVTVTATPGTLTFDPGDGATPVSCAGPGPVFDPSAGPSAAAPACSYSYHDASTAAPNGRSWPASLAVRWTVTWTASNGQSGALDPLVTTTPVAAVVREYQAIERSG
jgi:hypothetical protein